MTGRMDVANMLSDEPPRPVRSQTAPDEVQQESQRAHQYPTRQALMSNNNQLDHQEPAAQRPALSNGISLQNGNVNHDNPDPLQHPPKSIAFELLFDGNNNEKARLPMRVRIYPHDTTESIVRTVKDFYGLYADANLGVSFEDSTGMTLIARYENFTNNMVVYVRIIPAYSNSWHGSPSRANSLGATHSAQRTPHLDAGFEMAPHPAQVVNYGQPFSRPASRVSRMQSLSPATGENRRNLPVSKDRSRSGIKNRGDSFQAHLDGYNNEAPKYSSSDEEGGSVTSSRRARNEQLASAEISEKNIVEGGRRQRAKFESSELPLFVPPQVPAPNSISSISPQRRSNGQDNPSPFARPAQRPFFYSQPLQSPQSNGMVENPYGMSPAINNLVRPPPSQHGHRLRDRVGAAGAIPRLSTSSTGLLTPRPTGSSILPTPDPTIASCISDEDVALQLLRFSDSAFELSALESRGRTSNSTMDDTLSGKADIASSVSSEDEDDDTDTQQPIAPQMRSMIKTSKHLKQQGNIDNMLPTSDTIEASGDEDYDDTQDDYANEFGQPAKRPKLAGSKSMMASMKPRNQPSTKKLNKPSKAQQQITSRKTKPSVPQNTAKTAMSPPALPAHSRKASAASSAPPPSGLDGEDDLSTKPRCVRCRKSKKGCDRQRPCQRCKDAGIGIEGCISEDEGNGRKGRFGRHMGVPLANGGSALETEETMGISDGSATMQEKNKKRKRPMP